MECPKCQFDLSKWEDITAKCEFQLGITSTEKKQGYIILTLPCDNKVIQIGSFDFEERKFTPYNKDKMYYTESHGINQIEIKVMLQEHGYFKVYKKK